jgi:GxxExxY protein
MPLFDADVTDAILGAAIEVHRRTGPGLLESIYHRCLLHELHLRGLEVASEVGIDLEYKDLRIPACLRLDLLVANRVIVEIKSVDRLTSLHEAQLLTYLRLTGIRTGLLLNFNVPRLVDGIARRVI